MYAITRQLSYCAFKQSIPKDSNVRCSDWEKFPLSKTQENYAAIDAYVGYAIYMKLAELE
ncbi:Werner syndrome ATP-dependent helicase isoform X3 [Paramuricea clavata]|uniref:Werner syndrome ATP-dependent helicase isoform X3 n=1 Tax=Paramuricea clavata TaxID=317549 RepID=A0A6S7HDU1_PARCT|nr:Werner syndrome ATP-dependent helicase isoform X3 [Paramuricea clavata]